MGEGGGGRGEGCLRINQAQCRAISSWNHRECECRGNGKRGSVEARQGIGRPSYETRQHSPVKAAEGC